MLATTVRMFGVENIIGRNAVICYPFLSTQHPDNNVRHTVLGLRIKKSANKTLHQLILVEVHQREGKSIMRSVEGPKGTGDAFYGNEKDKKTSWFRDLFIFKLRCIYSTSKKKCSVLNF